MNNHDIFANDKMNQHFETYERIRQIFTANETLINPLGHTSQFYNQALDAQIQYANQIFAPYQATIMPQVFTSTNDWINVINSTTPMLQELSGQNPLAYNIISETIENIFRDDSSIDFENPDEIVSTETMEYIIEELKNLANLSKETNDLLMQVVETLNKQKSDSLITLAALATIVTFIYTFIHTLLETLS